MFTMESSKGNSFIQMQPILTYKSHNFPCLCFYNNHSLFIWGIVGFWKCEHSPEGLWLCRMVVTFMKDCVFSKGLWPFKRLRLFQRVLTFLKGCLFSKELWPLKWILPFFCIHFLQNKIDRSCPCVQFIVVILSSLKLSKF